MAQTEPLLTADSWQRQLRDSITDGTELLRLLKLSPEQVDPSTAAAVDFPLRVPHSFVRRMQPGNPRDPLLLQVLASGRELLDQPGYLRDPLQESGAANPRPGIVHKYRGRVLLIASGSCAVNCRYCFRRHFPYAENRNSRNVWREALEYVAEDSSIAEVILSGGDPLVLTDALLRDLVTQIAAIPHVQRLRIHTRTPIVLPARVTDDLLDAVSHPELQTVAVVHCNHANEIDEDVCAALDRVRQRGITLLNQAVLLRGVNDSAPALTGLSESLFAAGVLPYYLHLLDRVQGAAHFEVSDERARQLLGEITNRLPGYLVPKLVREQPGALAKQSLGIEDCR